MTNKTFAYARVSAKEQNTARQIAELMSHVESERDIFIDKASGKDFERPQYQALKNVLREGDTLFIKSIDRLGRNYKEITHEWSEITNNIKADIVVLDMPLLDTREKRELLGTFISDIVLQILSYVSEQERSFINQRQREGIERAKEAGVTLGRPKTKKPDNFADVCIKWQNGEMKAVEAMKALGLKKNTFYKLVKEHGAAAE